MLITCVLHIQPKGHRKPRSEVESLILAECLVGLNRKPSDSDLNALTHYATLPKYELQT